MKMQKSELYRLLEFPQGLINQLNEYENQRTREIPLELKNRLFSRNTWDDAVKELQLFLGEDPYCINLLWEQLNLVCIYSYEEYLKKNIPIDVFKATFMFITRFVCAEADCKGKYKYNHGWWFQRQVTLEEFRIDSLEFEYVLLNGNKTIEIHIPSDADMNIKALCSSINNFLEFTKRYYPEWIDVPLGTETWMLMPELEELLPPDSKILAFKHLFNIEKVDYEQTWYMDWIFPGFTEINEALPEKTSLHRALKAHLLSGKKFGIAKGNLVLDKVMENLR